MVIQLVDRGRTHWLTLIWKPRLLCKGCIFAVAGELVQSLDWPRSPWIFWRNMFLFMMVDDWFHDFMVDHWMMKSRLCTLWRWLHGSGGSSRSFWLKRTFSLSEVFFFIFFKWTYATFFYIILSYESQWSISSIADTVLCRVSCVICFIMNIISYGW